MRKTFQISWTFAPLSEMKFTEKKSSLLKQKNWEEIDYCLLSGADYEALAFMTQNQLSVSTTKELLMKKGNPLQNQPLLRHVFKPRGCPVMSAFAILIHFGGHLLLTQKGVNISQRC